MLVQVSAFMAEGSGKGIAAVREAQMEVIKSPAMMRQVTGMLNETKTGRVDLPARYRFSSDEQRQG